MLPRQQDRGDGDAFSSPEERSLTEELYRQQASRLFSYVRQHIPLLEDAEDILLDVFLTVFQHEPELVTMLEDEQRAWLWTVTRNRVTDYHRRTNRQQLVPLEHLAPVVENTATPEQIALQHEERRTLHAYIQQLLQAQQDVVQLRFLGGLRCLRCTDIAKVLHKREGTVRTILSRALNTLRTIYPHAH